MATGRRQFLTGTLAGLCSLAGARARGGEAARQESTLGAEYDLGAEVTYLNHASIGTTPRVVREAYSRVLHECETNPWFHMWGGGWEQARETVRAAAASYLGAAPEEIAITRNTTEAFQILALGLPLQAGDEVLFSSLNHAGASVAWDHASKRRGFRVRRFEIPASDVPGLTVRDLIELHVEQIRDETRVLVLPHMDNTLGIRHPIAEIAAAARARGVEYIAVDGAQTVAMVPVDVGQSGADFYATSGHKWLQGPKGTGLFYVRRDRIPQLDPMIVTWGQERWRDSARKFEDYGTRNLPALLALGHAIEFQRGLETEASHRERQLAELATWFRERCDATPGLTWRSPRRWECAGSLHAVGIDDAESAADLAEELFRTHGVVVRPFTTATGATLRVSPNLANTRADLEKLLDLLV